MKSRIDIPLNDGSTRNIDLSECSMEELVSLSNFLLKLNDAKDILPMFGGVTTDFDTESACKVVLDYKIMRMNKEEKEREKELNKKKIELEKTLMKNREMCWGKLADRYNAIEDFEARSEKISFNLPIEMEIDIDFPYFGSNHDNEVSGCIKKIKIGKTEELKPVLRNIIQNEIDQLIGSIDICEDFIKHFVDLSDYKKTKKEYEKIEEAIYNTIEEDNARERSILACEGSWAVDMTDFHEFAYHRLVEQEKKSKKKTVR